MRKIFVLLLIILLAQNSCYSAFFKNNNKNIDTSKGYVGKLPNLTDEYKPSAPSVAPPIFDKTKDFNSANTIKPIPRDDPAFVNIILKTDKTSPYVEDIQSFIDMLEQIYDSIENKDDVQIFNSKVYFFNASADYFKDKYSGKPESGYSSFKQILKLSENSKEVSTLRSDAEKYKKYMAYTDTGSEYSPTNIDMQLFDLKLSVEKTINMLKRVK